MTAFTEQKRPAQFIISESQGQRSRDRVTVASGQVLDVGAVVGKKTMGSATAAPVAGNTGNGTIGAVTLGPAAKPGVYRASCIEPGTDAGKFIVEDPSGTQIGVATVGVEFAAGGLTFTVSDGATDFVAGDAFTVTVAAGNGEVAELDPAAVDGTQRASGILYAAVDASASSKPGIAVVRAAIVAESETVWPDGISADEKAKAISELTALGILIRTAI